MKLTILYRISSNSYDKKRLPHATKEHCLKNFIKNFVAPRSTNSGNDYSFIVLKDGCDESTSTMVEQVMAQHIAHEYFRVRVREIHGGSSAQSFNRALDIAMGDTNATHFFFVEDDYLWLPGSRMVLEEGLERAHYVSLYDHPDKYINGDEGGNPYVDDGGEITRVFKTKSCHWKLTNSTTMTWATSAEILRLDEQVWREFTRGTYPKDFDAFIYLRNIGRTVATPLPGYSTHTEVQWLSPFTDWSKV